MNFPKKKLKNFLLRGYFDTWFRSTTKGYSLGRGARIPSKVNFYFCVENSKRNKSSASKSTNVRENFK